MEAAINICSGTISTSKGRLGYKYHSKMMSGSLNVKGSCHSDAIAGDYEAVKKYLEEGGSVDLLDAWKESMLHKAALGGELPIVKLLLSRGANVNLLNECKQTPLHYASISGRFDVVTELLVEGALVDSRDKFEQTALHCCSIYGHVEVAKELIEHGSDINAQDQHLMAPMHYSSANGHVDLIKFCIEKGAELSITDQDGKTPLHTSCCWAELRIVQTLINAGASTDVMDKKGKRPLQYLDAENLSRLQEMANEERGSLSSDASAGHLTTVDDGAVGRLEQSIIAQQTDIDSFRMKMSSDQSRMRQTQERMEWVINTEVGARQQQGRQITTIENKVGKFESILSKTLFLHKEVAEQQNQVLLQLQAAVKHKTSHLLDQQLLLGKRMDADQASNLAMKLRVDKMFADSAQGSMDHESQMSLLRGHMADRDASMELKMLNMGNLLEIASKRVTDAEAKAFVDVAIMEERLLKQEQASRLRQSQADEKSRGDAMEFAKTLDKVFTEQQNYRDKTNEDLLAQLRGELRQKETDAKNDCDKRDQSLVDLTSKYCDLLAKQQLLLQKMSDDSDEKDIKMAKQNEMIQSLFAQHATLSSRFDMQVPQEDTSSQLLSEALLKGNPDSGVSVHIRVTNESGVKRSAEAVEEESRKEPRLE